MSREHDTYSLRCWGCDRDIEIPVSQVVDDVAACRFCGARLEIQWTDGVSHRGETTNVDHNT